MNSRTVRFTGKTVSSNTVKGLRNYSTKRGSLKVNPEKLALDHVNSGSETTHLVINKILTSQKISITENKLRDLKKIKGVEFDLPLNDTKAFEKLVGGSTYKGFPGVYMFIHKATNQVYVGSSNLLRRRMEYYFNNEGPDTGKFVPLLRKEGKEAFKLVIYKLDGDLFTAQDALFLEQYFLLSKYCVLNTLKVVNFGPGKGKSVYVYDLTCTILYHYSESYINLKRVLGIHPDTCNKYIDTMNPYLTHFLLLSCPIPSAVPSNKSVKEISDIMQKERQGLYKEGTRRSIPIVLEIKEGNTLVDPSTLTTGNKLEFCSLTSCIEYLRSLGMTIKRDTLTKYIKIGKVFHNFLCKYQDKCLPADFEKISLLIEEYKKNKTDSSIKPANLKNKSILIISCHDNTERTFLSIMDTIRYYETLGIKLDRKTLYTRLRDGKEYKGFYFKYI